MSFVAVAVGAGLSLYSAQQQRKNANRIADATAQAGQRSPIRTSYGSSIGKQRDLISPGGQPIQGSFGSGGGFGSGYGGNYSISGGGGFGGFTQPQYGAEYEQVTIDPRIRQQREEVLGRLPGYRSSIIGAGQGFRSSLDDIRGRLRQNENAFKDARLNPLRQSIASARGNLIQGHARRGIGGSSFANQDITNFTTDTGRAFGDQAALAEQESIGALNQVDTQRYNSQLGEVENLLGLDSVQQQVAAANLSQELQALGLSQQDASAAIAAAGLRFQGRQASSDTLLRGASGIGNYLANRPQAAPPTGPFA